jgi:hypothetical protein
MKLAAHRTNHAYKHETIKGRGPALNQPCAHNTGSLLCSVKVTGCCVGGIFISYRRKDAAPWAGRLYERLAREFPRDQLLMDVDAIEPGLDLVHVLDEEVSSCDVLLSIIGPAWVEARHG